MIKIKEIFWEIVPVTIGVIFGLMVNNWNEENKANHYVQKMLQKVDQELLEVEKDIDSALVRQNNLLDSLNFYLEVDSISIVEILMKAGGIGAPSINTKYWNALSNTKAELVDLERLVSLSEIESLGLHLSSLSNNLIVFIYDEALEKSYEKKLSLSIRLQDFMNVERELKDEIKAYSEIGNK